MAKTIKEVITQLFSSENLDAEFNASVLDEDGKKHSLPDVNGNTDNDALKKVTEEQDKLRLQIKELEESNKKLQESNKALLTKTDVVEPTDEDIILAICGVEKEKRSD